MNNNNQKVLQAIPRLLHTINDVTKNGFFSEFETKIEMISPDTSLGIISICIKGKGYIPSNKKFLAAGIEPLVDVKKVIQKVKDLAERTDKKVKTTSFSIKGNDWPEYNKDGEKIIGSKGETIDIFFHVQFK